MVGDDESGYDGVGGGEHGSGPVIATE